jgi:hypothetical protein
MIISAFFLQILPKKAPPRRFLGYRRGNHFGPLGPRFGRKYLGSQPCLA